MTNGLIVTTSRKASPERLAEAELWAARLCVPLLRREEMSLAELTAAAGVPGALVVGGDRVIYREPARALSYFFHPGMARRRIRNLESGRGDPMITAMRLRAGDSVLDCTLGRGTDAAVASHVVSLDGKVVGLEKSPILAWLTLDGLATYEIDDPLTREAMRRVEAHCADYRESLAAQQTCSFDVVYFDPIFDQPLERSSGMIPLRALACPDPLTAETISLGLQVARRSVVIKQHRGTDLWSALPFEVTLISGGKSRIEYGVVEA
jgi:hypothetical protein